VENVFTTSLVHQAYLEPHSCLTYVDEDGHVHMWAPNKAPYNLRQQLSDALGLPLEMITLHHAHIGGDFGGKGSPMDTPLCYFLALHSKRPVKLVMDYIEEFMAGNPRHSTLIRLKTGVKRDGSITAHQVQFYVNAGAFAGYKPRGIIGGAMQAAGPYRTATLRVESTHVYTNTHVAANLIRGLKQIVTDCGLDASKLIGNWATLELGVATWLGSRHLERLILEIYDPSTDGLIKRFEFNIDYTYDPLGNGELWIDPATVSYAVRKAGAVPSQCSYDVLASTAPGRRDVAGWTRGTLRSTAGMRRRSVGAMVGGGSLAASLSYWS
jgi:hypothetical protein